MNVESKVYYLKENGKVIYTTGEFSGGVIKTTFEYDYNSIDVLNQYDINEIECIEIDFGTYLNTFVNAKSYVVDISTKQLKVDYYTQEEIDQLNQPTEEISLEAQVDQLELDNANLLLESVQKDILISQLQGGV